MKRPLVVADIGLNHNGQLDWAKAMIATAAANGVDYVKFQKRVPEAVYVAEYLDRPRRTQWGETIRAEKQGLEFGRGAYDEIDGCCRRLGIGWFASAWDVESVRFLAPYHPDFIKVSSACLTNRPVLEAIRASKVKAVMSIGMSTSAEITAAIETLGEECLQHVLHCVALYPCLDEYVNMAKFWQLRTTVPGDCRVGFSNHSPGALFCLQAAVMGAAMIEFHFTLSHALPGPDHESSFDPAALSRFMADLDSLEMGWGRPDAEPTDGELEKGAHYLWRATT